MKNTLTMAELRYKIFRSKKDIPKIESLQLADGPLYQHIIRVHLQVILWKFMAGLTQWVSWSPELVPQKWHQPIFSRLWHVCL